ncbi:MAG: hypothetical protein D3916_12785, partial [Candidatus Electrothrix sp. MAN1_4]|nr:hypothetical protein [Candidatus Electrothrix sp. MAN1_4]
CFAQEPVPQPSVDQIADIKISDNAIASLEGQLAEEQINFLEKHIVGKKLDQIESSQLVAQNDVPFTIEEVGQIQDAVLLYFDMINKIKEVTPSIFSFHNVSLEKEKLEKSLNSLMTEEKEAALVKINQLQKQHKEEYNNFKSTAEEFKLSNITLEKLPGMLRDLEYKDSSYDIIHKELSQYLGQVNKLNSAGSIITSLDEVSKAIKKAERELKRTKNESDKEMLASQIEKLVKRKEDLQTNFTINVTGMDPTELSATEKKEINMEEEFRKIFSPLVLSLQSITETSRKIEDLRSVIGYCEQQLSKVRYGLEEINALLEDVLNDDVKKKLINEKEFWEQKEKELATKLEIAKQQVIELQNNKYTPLDMLNNFFETIFSQRGINIFFAFVVFLAIFFIMFFVRQLFLLVNPFDRIPSLNFLSGTINVMLYLLTFIVAFLSTIIYLYMVGEIISLILVLMLLFVIGLAMKEALPNFIGQIRLLLGYGSVRRGERVIYNGIPWLVQSIGIFSELKNPFFANGNLRLPIDDLLKMRSRSYHTNDPWFPTRQGDWVIMSDETYGQIIFQSQDIIQIKMGGAYRSYTPSDFLQQHPVNLSMNLFTVVKMLYLDIRHGEIAITEVSTTIRSLLKKAVEQQKFGKHLKDIVVELHDIESSSLKIGTRICFSGKAASEYREIGWLVQQTTLDACNKHGWQIASQQVTVHQVAPYEL